jgi:hypothetical protein
MAIARRSEGSASARWTELPPGSAHGGSPSRPQKRFKRATIYASTVLGQCGTTRILCCVSASLLCCFNASKSSASASLRLDLRIDAGHARCEHDRELHLRSGGQPDSFTRGFVVHQQLLERADLDDGNTSTKVDSTGTTKFLGLRAPRDQSHPAGAVTLKYNPLEGEFINLRRALRVSTPMTATT